MSSDNEKKGETGNLPDTREERGLKLPTEPRPAPNPAPQQEEKK